MKSYEFVNLGVKPETRVRLNLWKVQQEVKRQGPVTTDEVINELLDAVGAERTEETKAAVLFRKP